PLLLCCGLSQQVEGTLVLPAGLRRSGGERPRAMVTGQLEVAELEPREAQVEIDRALVGRERWLHEPAPLRAPGGGRRAPEQRLPVDESAEEELDGGDLGTPLVTCSREQLHRFPRLVQRQHADGKG